MALTLPVTMCASTSRRVALIPIGVLDALLAVHGVATCDHVKDLAVRRDRYGAGDVDRAVLVLPADLLVVAADGDGSMRVQALDVAPTDATNADSIRTPLVRSACSSALAIDATVWSMLTTTPFLSPDDVGAPLPMIERPPSVLISAINATTLLVPTSIAAMTASRSTPYPFIELRAGL